LVVLKVHWHPSPPLHPPRSTCLPALPAALPPDADPDPAPPPSQPPPLARAQVSAPAAVMMIDSPGSPRPLAARAPDRMPTPAPLATHEGVVGRRCGAGGSLASTTSSSDDQPHSAGRRPASDRVSGGGARGARPPGLPLDSPPPLRCSHRRRGGAHALRGGGESPGVPQDGA
jgi:hypothetical protein